MKSKNKQAFMDGRDINIPIEEKKIDLPIVDDDDSIENMFRNEQTSQQNDIKELFHEDRVKARTDLSSRQIKLITKAFYLAKITGMKEVNEILRDFMTLRISDSRQSRKEFVEGLKAKIDTAIQQGSMNVRNQFAK
jgi:hypothetical protein